MAAWEPTQQSGTPWVASAVPHDVQVIFWLSVVNFIFGGLGVFSALCQEKQYNKLPQKESGSFESIEVQGQSKRVQTHFTNILQLVPPILGICAVKLDSQGTLKAFCVIILVVLTLLAIMLFITLVAMLTAGFWNGCRDGVGTVCVAISALIAVGLATSLHIVSIVYAWQYAFPA